MRILTLAKASLLALSLAATACGPSIYMAQDFRSYTPKHKTVAILPATVMMQLRPNEAKRLTLDQQHDMERKSGLDFQGQEYSWLLRRGQQRAFTVTFQDVSQTNALLAQNNIAYGDLSKHTPQELSKLLGVDAVMSTNVRTTKPMSEGAAVAVGLLMGTWGATNQANITINIHENEVGKLLWKYDYVAAGSAFSSTENIVQVLMRNASKKFPYTPVKG
jgi:hypothetical protein